MTVHRECAYCTSVQMCQTFGACLKVEKVKAVFRVGPNEMFPLHPRPAAPEETSDG